jgi:hypothetical protein
MQAQLVDQQLERAKEEARQIARDHLSEPHLGRATLYTWALEGKGPGNQNVLEPGRYTNLERYEIYKAGEELLPWNPRCEFFGEAGGSVIHDPQCFDPVAVVARVTRDIDCDSILYLCAKHAPEFEKEEGFIRFEEYHGD